MQKDFSAIPYCCEKTAFNVMRVLFITLDEVLCLSAIDVIVVLISVVGFAVKKQQCVDNRPRLPETFSTNLLPQKLLHVNPVCAKAQEEVEDGILVFNGVGLLPTFRRTVNLLVRIFRFIYT